MDVTSDAVAPCNCCGGTDWVPQFEENGLRLGRCRGCDLFYIDDMPTAETRMTEMESGHFASTQRVLDAKRQAASERALRLQFQEYVDLARQHVAKGRWLDVGCGTGTLLGLARDAGFHPEGIELTGDRLAAARGAGFTVHDQPVEDAGFPDGAFEVISLINVFSHLTDPTATFIELRRILAPGGVLVVATGEMTSEVRKVDVRRWYLGDHLHFLGERTMPIFASKVGLTVAAHQRAWMPDLMFSKPWLETKGGSTARNIVKISIARTPGALPLVRAAMLKKHRENGAYAAKFALTRTHG